MACTTLRPCPARPARPPSAFGRGSNAIDDAVTQLGRRWPLCGAWQPSRPWWSSGASWTAFCKQLACTSGSQARARTAGGPQLVSRSRRVPSCWCSFLHVSVNEGTGRSHVSAALPHHLLWLKTNARNLSLPQTWSCVVSKCRSRHLYQPRNLMLWLAACMQFNSSVVSCTT